MRHPSGYVTFLFTDIEGSTSRYESDPEAMSRARATHDGILRSLLTLIGTGGVGKTRLALQVAAELVEWFDGVYFIPLAIELAAARIRMFPAQALLQRLQKRLTLLTSSAGDVPERQRTMRATIDWSYSLLTDAEQRLFARLGVFAGGCTIESAEAVCNSTSDLSIDVLEGLTLLVEKSLLRQEGEQESRFQMLETIREYAAERLTEQGDGPAQQEAHGRFYLDLAQKATPELRGADQLSWLDRLDADRDNLRAAIGWFRERKDERFLSFAMAMWRYWYTRGFFTEARGWLEAGISSWKEGPHDDQALLASALNAAGILAYALEDFKEARERYEEGLQLCREQGNQGGVAFALNNLGMVAQAEGRYEDARTLQEESLRQMRPLGDKEAIAGLLFHLGSLAQRQGRYGDARGIHEESLTLYRELGDTYGSAMSLNGLGEVAQQQKRYGDAQELYEESLRLKRELGDTFGIAVSLTGLGTLASAQDEHERATTLLAAASVQLASIGIALPPDHREWMEQALALARGTLSEPVYRAAWERGQATDAQGATNHAVE